VHERAQLRARVQGRDRHDARRLRRGAARRARAPRARVRRRARSTAVARRCGFGTVETLRRAFARRLGVSPGAYRDRFAA
jgi:AraC-like DNA-binding protein